MGKLDKRSKSLSKIFLVSKLKENILNGYALWPSNFASKNL